MLHIQQILPRDTLITGRAGTASTGQSLNLLRAGNLCFKTFCLNLFVQTYVVYCLFLLTTTDTEVLDSNIVSNTQSVYNCEQLAYTVKTRFEMSQCSCKHYYKY